MHSWPLSHCSGEGVTACQLILAPKRQACGPQGYGSGKPALWSHRRELTPPLTVSKPDAVTEPTPTPTFSVNERPGAQPD
ncbi:hypothetical protein QQF64_031333 [Cirrhinus molitorella]|uniref:Uncharacterized protein n=1 Tax=Cirrhinus molitorella TaxID=172907 RepID=A0ABR3MWM7_9TELE